MTDDQKKTDNPANTTGMTDQQAATNDLRGAGRGARQEPGAQPDQDLINDKVKGDGRGDLPDIDVDTEQDKKDK